MQAREVTIDLPSENTPVKLVVMGDLHIGNAATDELLISKVAARIRERYAFWVDLGDRCDFINIDDKRFDPKALPNWCDVSKLGDLVSAQADRYIQLMSSVADKCLAAVVGNHEYSIYSHYRRDVYSEINRSMGLPSDAEFGFSGFLRLRLVSHGKVVWRPTLYLFHGSSGTGSTGAAATALEKRMAVAEADVYCVGHTHNRLASMRRRLAMDPNTGKVVTRQLAFVNTGAYMTNLAGYAEQRGLYPQEVGPLEVWFMPGTKEIKIVQ